MPKTASVSLLQGFCPLCFKGRIGHSRGLRVPSNSPNICKVQSLHSRAGNGLPLLDLECDAEEDDYCENPLLCSVNCLVCGRAIIHGEDPAYAMIRSTCQGEEPDVCSWFEIDQALTDNGAAWTEQWNTPVHKKCARKGRCKCWIPLGATECKKHKPLPAIPLAQAVTRPAVVPKPAAPVARTVLDIKVMSKGTASWLAGMCGPATCTVDNAPDERPRACQAPSRNQAKKPKPPPPKPNKNLLLAGSKCQKLDTWASPAQHAMPAKSDKPAARGAFSLSSHSRSFDDRLHGYTRTSKGMFYVFPDGRREQVYSCVNIIKEDGTLVPS